jgi:hypothetical protein
VSTIKSTNQFSCCVWRRLFSSWGLKPSFFAGVDPFMQRLGKGKGIWEATISEDFLIKKS